MSIPAELREALEASDGGAHLRDLDSRGLLTGWVPALERGRGFEQPELHAYTVLEHNLATAEAFDAILGDSGHGKEFDARTGWLEREELLAGGVDGVSITALTRLACLVHDIAKPATATILEGRLRFPRHGPAGAVLLTEKLPTLGFGQGATRFVAAMVRYHLRPRELVRPWPPTDRAVRRFLNDLDGHMLPLLLVNLCDGMATQGPRYTPAHFERHCNFLNYVMARVFELEDRDPKPLITGQELLSELGMQSGRLVGAVLTSVLAAQRAGAVTSRKSALEHARAVLAEIEASEQQSAGQ